MNSLELKSYCLKHSGLKSYLNGAVPQNLIPISVRKKPTIFYIMNTVASYEKGEHWVVIMV